MNSPIFSQLVALLQSRPVSLEKLFSFELHFFPPAISNFGELNLPGIKATLVHEIWTTCHNARDGLEEYSSKAVKIIDGGTILYQFVGKPSMTFQKYAKNIFKVLLTYFTFFKQIDIVFDVYLLKKEK